MNSFKIVQKDLVFNSKNCKNNKIHFLKDIPRWMQLINVLISLLFLISIGIALVQGFFLMRPRSNWWNFLNLGPRREYLLYVIFTYELLWKVGLSAFVLFVGMNFLTLAKAISGKLDWNIYLIWLYIHIGLLVLVAIGFVSWDGVIP